MVLECVTLVDHIPEPIVIIIVVAVVVLVLFLSLLVIVNQIGKVFRRADRMENDLMGDAKLRVERGRPSMHSHGL